MKAPKLNQVQAHGDVWLLLKAHYEERLRSLRAKLENPNYPEAERTGLIHRIDEIKQLLSIGAKDE